MKGRGAFAVGAGATGAIPVHLAPFPHATSAAGNDVRRGTAAVDVGFEVVLDSVPVAPFFGPTHPVFTGPAVAIAVPGAFLPAGAALAGAAPAGLAAAIGVRLVAVLGAVIAEGVGGGAGAFPAEVPFAVDVDCALLRCLAAASPLTLTRGGADASAIQVGLVAVLQPVAAGGVALRDAGAVLAKVALAVGVLEAGSAVDAAEAEVPPAIDVGLAAVLVRRRRGVLDAVAALREAVRQPPGLPHANLLRAVVVGVAATPFPAGCADAAAAILAGFVAVPDVVGARGRRAALPVDTFAGIAIGVNGALAAVGVRFDGLRQEAVAATIGELELLVVRGAAGVAAAVRHVFAAIAGVGGREGAEGGAVVGAGVGVVKRGDDDDAAVVRRGGRVAGRILSGDRLGERGRVGVAGSAAAALGGDEQREDDESGQQAPEPHHAGGLVHFESSVSLGDRYSTKPGDAVSDLFILLSIELGSPDGSCLRRSFLYIRYTKRNTRERQRNLIFVVNERKYPHKGDRTLYHKIALVSIGWGSKNPPVREG